MTSAATRACIAAIMVVLAACGGRPLVPSSEAPASEASPGLQAGTLAEGLVAPWALAFAPDGRLFLSERPGRVRVIEDGVLLAQPVATIDDVAAVGEGGLLGLALHPDFSEEPGCTSTTRTAPRTSSAIASSATRNERASSSRGRDR